MKTKHWVWLVIGIFLAGLATSAYSRKSGGFGGSSFKSKGSSFKFSSRTSPSKPPVVNTPTPKPKITATNNTTHNSGKIANTPVKKSTLSNTQSKQNSIAHNQRVAVSKNSYQAQKTQFKPRPVVNNSRNNTPTNVTKVTNVTNVYNKPAINTTRYNRSTYYERRSRAYNDWHVPSYSYNSYSSFGAWDSMAMWYMLSQAQTNAMYANMFYHQSRDPGFQEWRKEANRLSADNAELKAQLNQLDQRTSGLKKSGVSIDPTYTPPGVDGDILLSADMIKQTAPEFKLCTGNLTKTYHKVGHAISNNTESVRVLLIPTNGSIDNLNKLDNNQCDGALVQRDSYLSHVISNNGHTQLDYTRILSPYSEVVHLVCTRDSGIEDLSDMYNRSDVTVAVGGSGSGGNVTWTNLVNENSKMKSIKTISVDGIDALNSIRSKQADCILNISGVNNKFMQTLDMSSKQYPMELVEWDDTTLEGMLDPAMDTMYSRHTLSASFYKNLQIDNKIGFFNVDTEVIILPADLIVSNKWKTANQSSFEDLSNEVIKITDNIRRASH